MTQWKTWAQTTALGFAALSEWQLHMAAEHWINAYAGVRNGEEMGNPCFASAQNNAGLGYALMGSFDEARHAFAAAECAWGAVAQRIAGEDVDLASGSSTHHLRLASRHSVQFSAHLRREYQRLTGVGGALSRLNAGHFGLSEAAGPGDAARIIETFGADSFEGLLLRPAPQSGDEPRVRSGLDDQARRAAGHAAALTRDMSFWRLLETAVDMTALLPSALHVRAGKRLKDQREDL